MSEEILQRRVLENIINIGEYSYINIGNTTFNQLLNANIISNKVSENFIRKRPDALILEGKQPCNIKAIVEYKDVTELKTESKFKDAVKQVAEYCYETSIDIGVVSDGEKYWWFLINSQGDDGDFVFSEVLKASYIRDSNKEKIVCYEIQSNKTAQSIVVDILKNIDRKSAVLLKDRIIVNPTNLAKMIWQSIFLATGDDPKMCLMTFTEIFMYKYLSDLGILKTNENGVNISFQSTFNVGKNKCLVFYLTNVRTYIKRVFKPSVYDDTTIINGLSLKEGRNQDELFYEILKSFINYGNLKNVSVEFKSNLFEEFLKGTNGISVLAQFFTPRNIVRAIVEMSGLSNLPEGASICDPACGVGGFLIEGMIKRGVKNEFVFNSDLFESYIKFNGFDIDDKTIVLAKASLVILLSIHITENTTKIEEIGDFINSVFKSFHKSSIGSLSELNNKYDLILSNPPYVRKGMTLYNQIIDNDLDGLKKFYNIKINSKEGLFLFNIIKSLKTNGKAFVIMPDGFFHTRTDTQIRKYLLENCILDAIISLPPRTFYTTPKKTYIIAFTKKQDSSISQTAPVFNYIVRDVGESLDASRINTSLQDLNRMIQDFKIFSVLKQLETEGRKEVFLRNIDYYVQNNMWMPDRLLDEEAKIELGIKEKDVYSSTGEVLNDVENFYNFINENIVDKKEDFEKEFEAFSYKEVSLSDMNVFKISTETLGYSKKDYLEMNVGKKNGYPLYTAASNVMAYLDKNHEKVTNKECDEIISIATDGDGTAGTNIIIHNSPCFINSSRMVIRIKEKTILPKFVYYSIKDIKLKYGLGYSVKCNEDNLKQYVNISVPIDDNGRFDIKKQQEIIKFMEKQEKIFLMLESFYEKHKDIKNYSKFLSFDPFNN